MTEAGSCSLQPETAISDNVTATRIDRPVPTTIPKNETRGTRGQPVRQVDREGGSEAEPDQKGGLASSRASRIHSARPRRPAAVPSRCSLPEPYFQDGTHRR